MRTDFDEQHMTWSMLDPPASEADFEVLPDFQKRMFTGVPEWWLQLGARTLLDYRKLAKAKAEDEARAKARAGGEENAARAIAVKRWSIGEYRQRVGQVIRANRARAGYTLSTLARATGLNASVLSRIESGERSPSLDQIVTIAQAVEFSLIELFEWAVPDRCLWCDVNVLDHIRICPDSGAIREIRSARRYERRREG